MFDLQNESKAPLLRRKQQSIEWEYLGGIIVKKGQMVLEGGVMNTKGRGAIMYSSGTVNRGFTRRLYGEGNSSRYIQDEALQAQIDEVLMRLLYPEKF